jgi:PAS domain S-box-containing protein
VEFTDPLGASANVPVRILLVDDNRCFLDAAEVYLRQQRSFEVAGTAVDSRQAIEQALILQPDVILLDLNLGEESAIPLIPAIKERLPGARIIVTTILEGRGYEELALQAGADAFVYKSKLTHTLVPTIARLMEGLNDPRIHSAGPSQAHFKRLIEGTREVIYRFELGPQRGFSFVNPAAATVTGYTPEEFYADPDLGIRLIHPDDRPIYEVVYAGELPADRPIAVRWVRKSGETIWTEHHLVPVRDDAGELIALEALVRDITPQKGAEDALKRNEARLGNILSSASEAIITVNEKHEITLFNESAERMFGWTREEAIGRPLGQLIPTRFAESHAKHIQSFDQSAETTRRMSTRREVTGVRKNGNEFVCEIGISKHVEEGQTFFTAILQDVTDQREARDEVIAMQDRFHALTENAPDGIALVDTKGRVRFVSPSGRRIFGYDWAENLEMFSAGNVHADDLPEVLSIIPRLIEQPTQNPTLQYRARHENGSWIWIECTFTNLLTVRSVEAIVINFRDITERKQSEARIREQLERLSALREVDQLIASTFDARMSLNGLLSRAIRLLAVDAAAILLIDPVSNELEYSAGLGFRTNAVRQARIKTDEDRAEREDLERLILKIQPGTQASDTPFLSGVLLEGEDFVSYFGSPLIVKGKVIGVMEVYSRSQVERDQDWADFFGTLAAQAAIMIDSSRLFNDLQVSNTELTLAYEATIEGWSRALDLRDRETEGHTQRVTELTMRLARFAGFPDEELIQIRRGALLHDIGKLGVPDHILLKSEVLSETDWEIMKQHPVFAYEMLRPIRYLKSAAIEIPHCHHERWDGRGYPRGLKAEEIPMAARIFAVVDVWDALTSDRPYRAAWTRETALAYIKEQSGAQFDPQVVEKFLALIE